MKKTHPMNQHLAHVRWARQPWKTVGNTELAERLGCSTITVWQKRRIHAPDTIRKTARAVGTVDWDKADWAKHDIEIAKDLRCAASSVYKQRDLLGMPKGPRKIGSGRPVKVNVELFDPMLTYEQNAKILGCSVNYVHVISKKALALAELKLKTA